MILKLSARAAAELWSVDVGCCTKRCAAVLAVTGDG